MLRPRRFAVKQYFRILCGFPTKTARGFITIYVHNGRICRCLQNNFQFTKTNFTNVVSSKRNIFSNLKKNISFLRPLIFLKYSTNFAAGTRWQNSRFFVIELPDRQQCVPFFKNRHKVLYHSTLRCSIGMSLYFWSALILYNTHQSPPELVRVQTCLWPALVCYLMVKMCVFLTGQVGCFWWLDDM